MAVERENNLERSRAQLELDWQRRFEDVERQQYEKSEDFVKKLSRGRDEVSCKGSLQKVSRFEEVSRFCSQSRTN